MTCSVKLTCSSGCTKQINHGKIIRAHIRFCKMAANSGGPKKNSSASRSGGRKPVKVSNDHCRICNSSFALMGTKCSNENLFLPSGRKECAGCVLADTLFIVGVKLVQDPGKSDKVCHPCARKIRNAADCFTFITGKLTENDAEPKEQQTTANDRFRRKFIYLFNPSKSLAASPSSKRQKRLLPTTVTPVRAFF